MIYLDQKVNKKIDKLVEQKLEQAKFYNPLLQPKKPRQRLKDNEVGLAQMGHKGFIPTTLEDNYD